jgi:hypothetical protein
MWKAEGDESRVVAAACNALRSVQVRARRPRLWRARRALQGDVAQRQEQSPVERTIAGSSPVVPVVVAVV